MKGVEALRNLSGPWGSKVLTVLVVVLLAWGLLMGFGILREAAYACGPCGNSQACSVDTNCSGLFDSVCLYAGSVGEWVAPSPPISGDYIALPNRCGARFIGGSGVCIIPAGSCAGYFADPDPECPYK